MYPASKKLEIIRTVEAPHLPTRQTLKMLGIPSSTYYDWYARWSDGGVDALADRSPRPKSVWNRIPDKVREDVVDFALEHEDLTPRELAVKYTDEKRYFVSEASVYRILSAEDLITAPAQRNCGRQTLAAASRAPHQWLPRSRYASCAKPDRATLFPQHRTHRLPVHHAGVDRCSLWAAGYGQAGHSDRVHSVSAKKFWGQ
ncbi:homeodomain-containing protein [Ruegeria conchae]|uniref:Homeodomain-containing protein n=1 Tax=Ruegeria conchae TaxID=981384 RepID=A0A497ZKL4_9RHOB|nr:homeodomain-containing protein [Ruegeria conchae]